jgi:uncharacterized protein
LFAIADIPKGATLIVAGGRAVTRETLQKFPKEVQTTALQIGDEIFLLQHGYEEGDCLNHSCDANAGCVGQIVIVAMRDIQQGEEVCMDYAMADLSDNDEFECRCGAPDCRGYVTGKDWQLPAVQVEYKGYFMPHVQKAIDDANQGGQK